MDVADHVDAGVEAGSLLFIPTPSGGWLCREGCAGIWVLVCSYIQRERGRGGGRGTRGISRRTTRIFLLALSRRRPRLKCRLGKQTTHPSPTKSTRTPGLHSLRRGRSCEACVRDSRCRLTPWRCVALTRLWVSCGGLAALWWVAYVVEYKVSAPCDRFRVLLGSGRGRAFRAWFRVLDSPRSPYSFSGPADNQSEAFSLVTYRPRLFGALLH